MTSTAKPIATVTGNHRLIWSVATAIAVSAHLGFWAMALWRSDAPDVDDQPAGSIVMELSPIVTSSATSAPSSVVGPESTDSAASQPQSVTKPPERIEQEVPIAEPSPTVPEPDLAVPNPVAEAKPVADPQPEDHKPDEQREAPAELSVASQAMSPQRIEAPPAPKSTDPEIGVSPQVVRSKITWHKAIAAHLNRFKRYPSDAQGQMAKGEVIVKFATDRAGRVLSASVARTSGSELLDAEAIAMLWRAAPLPAPSTDIPGEAFTLTVPVVYRQK